MCEGSRPHKLTVCRSMPATVRCQALTVWRQRLCSAASNLDQAVNRTGRHLRATGERWKTFLILSVVLAITAGVTLLNIGMALESPGVAAPFSRPAAINETLVRDFY